MIKTGVGHATRQFFQSTTLHGFKYLYSGFYTDRICWLSWCVASTCCAGTLCAVLWARFLQVPALLTHHSAMTAPQPLPTVAVCLPAQSLAHLLLRHLTSDKDVVRRLSLTFSRILEGKEAQMENLVSLEQLLTANNMTVLEALHHNIPPCYQFAKRCRWQDTMMPCDQLFHRQLTQFGVCCVMQPNKIKNVPQEKSIWRTERRLSLVLQCSNASLFYGCQFFTKYDAEETVTPVVLTPGSAYLARLTYISVQDNDSEQIVAGTCVSSNFYSQRHCLDKCMERLCGCSNPFRTIFDDENDVPPPCQVSKINCLKKTDNSSCNCMPSCRKLTTELALEDSPMQSVYYTLDPLYSGVSVSESTVLHLRVLVGGSSIFTRHPTETWLTLLSSLGGVFNMFLGVGLFSALEFVFFILIRLPAAIKKAPEMHLPITHVHTRS